MRRQTSDHDCGPTAIANAFEFHHKRIGLRGLRDLVGTTAETPEGGDEHDIMRALLAYGSDVDEHASGDARRAWVWLLESLDADRPVLLCLDRWEHWVTAIGRAGRQVVVYDSSVHFGGTFVLRFRDLRPRWEAARRVRRAGGAPGVRFYGIAVGPPTL